MMYSSISAPVAGVAARQTNRVLRNAYLLLAITLLPTIAGAFLGAFFPIFAYAGFGLSLIIILAGMFGLQTMVIRNRHSAAGIAWLLVFTTFMGYILGPSVGLAVGLKNGLQIIATAAGGTAAIFFVMAGYAATTKRDFSSPSLSKILIIGMFMAFGLSVINAFFLQASAISLAVSAIFIPIAAMFILHTVNRVVRGGETNYIMATMTLYIMLFNIFQSLLHFLMMFGGSRD